NTGTPTDPGYGVFDAATGYKVAGAATSGNYLRGNGTNFVSAALAAADLTGTSLPATIVTSSLTSLGTVSTGTWNATKIGLAYGGTNADLSATGGANQFLKQSSSGAAISVGGIVSADLTSALTTPPPIGGTTPAAGTF